MSRRKEDVNPLMLERVENRDFCEAGIAVIVLMCVRFDKHWLLTNCNGFIIYVEDSLPDLRPSDKDLLYIHSQVGVKVTVHDDVYDLIGEISSSTDSDRDDRDVELEEYLTANLSESLSQVMAQTKQTERKEEENRQRYPPARKSPQRDDSDSSIEVAARAQESEPMGHSKS